VISVIWGRRRKARNKHQKLKKDGIKIWQLNDVYTHAWREMHEKMINKSDSGYVATKKVSGDHYICFFYISSLFL
jgi:hypothetical protein